ncbi:MAG: ABC transporter permease [Catenulispora sp.]|nr:ABC transporter permease [Catenulispora sp.]
MTFIAKKLAAGAATVLASSLIIFLALSRAPGDPVALILGPHATNAERAAMSARLGLTDPVLVRYWHWLTDALHGDFGNSLLYRQPVSGLLGPRLMTTLILVGLSALIAVATGVALGIFGGVTPRARPLVSAVTGVGTALPGFVVSSALISIFAVNLAWFPTFGAGHGFFDQLWHLTLPAIALAMSSAAYVAQMTAAAVNDEAGREHVATATGRGLPRSVVLRRHVLRNAAIPVLTVSGLTAASLVAGSVVVESAFGIDGLGSLLVKSVASKDYPVVNAASLVIVIVFVAVMTVLDISQTALDPRLRERA